MTIFLTFLFLLFAGFSYLVIKKVENKALNVIYGVILFFSMVFFVALAVAGPVVRDSVAQGMDAVCGNTTTTSVPDLFYQTGNYYLCTTACPCKADPKLWDLKDQVHVNPNATNQAQA